MLSIIILIIVVILVYKAAPPEKGPLITLALFGLDCFTSYYYAGGLGLC